MTDRLTEEIIWDTRKPVALKKLESISRTPCIVKLANDNKLCKSGFPRELATSQGLLLHSIVSHRKILCRCAGSSDSIGSTDDHQKRFSMPVAYDGLVELLSENGEASRPLNTISEIANIAPENFLIRSRIEALAEVTDQTSIRTLERGTVLAVKGTARVTSRQVSHVYLHCIDKDGFYVYLNYETKGVFSPFAGPKNISGVHTIDSLLKRFRLPCTVRVVSGKIPREACDEERPGVFRLIEIRKEKTVILAPLSAKQMLIPISLKADLSFYKPANMRELSTHFIFRQILDSCTNKVEQYLRTMQVLISSSSTMRSRQLLDHEEENNLFEDVDEIYPYIRRGGIPPRMMRAQSLDNEIISATNTSTIHNRCSSQPVIGSRERSGSLAVSQVLKKHTVSSATTETTFQFRSTSDSLTLGKTDVLRQFIQKYTSKESLQSRSSQDRSSADLSDDDIYFTLDHNRSHKPSSVKDILSIQSEPVTNRG